MEKDETTPKYKLVAPDIDRLLRYFERGYLNPSGVTPRLAEAMRPLFEALSPLAPLKSNDEAKAIWILVPRGKISDFDSFEDLKAYGEVKTYKQYEKLWREEYPDEKKWYRLVIVDGKNREGKTDFRAVSLGDKTIISAQMDAHGESSYTEDAAVTLCALLVDAAKESLALLKNGTYNQMVATSLPYQFRTGVIKRSVLWKYESDYKDFDFKEISDETISAFRSLMASGANDETKIGRMKTFTANDFFRACEIGYKAIGYDTSGKSPSELYLRYADGRDEGLTGTGHGLNEGPGIDFDDAAAWNDWYFDRKQSGGHPWEVVRGGNSTHVSLYVSHDEHSLGFQFRLGKISEEEYNAKKGTAGYYFTISGKHRPFESVTFYTALSASGLPVVLHDAEEILARFDGSDYMGIVPHSVIPRYCESMFPEAYGHVIDFMHVYDEEIAKYGKEITWIPESEAKLRNDE